ncbi:MAG: hypothetical protein ABI318_24070 [Chthoniobacteraceae bacterium]
MKGALLIGIALILGGAAILSYGYFSYRTRETVFKVGSVEATADRTKTVSLPPILGWGLVAGGVCVVIFSARKKA